jgi:tetratricopeptide (TPR) repeat protein
MRNCFFILLGICALCSGAVLADTPHNWIAKGVYLNSQNNNAGALDAYNHAIEMEPTNWLAWLGKGDAYYGLGKYEDAISCYSRVYNMTQDKNDQLSTSYAMEALRDEAACLELLGRPADMVKTYEKMIKEESDYQVDTGGEATCWKEKGALLERLGRHTEAALAYNKADELDRNQSSSNMTDSPL